MSEYSTVQTEITDTDLLRRALQDIGLPFEEAGGNALKVYGYRGHDVRCAQFVVRKEHLNQAWCDLGYAWNQQETRFDAMVDMDDRRATKVAEQVTQRVAYHQVMKTVNEYGMLVESETVTPAGEIQIVVRAF
jgi:Protein of unknown function (DUF1257)